MAFGITKKPGFSCPLTPRPETRDRVYALASEHTVHVIPPVVLTSMQGRRSCLGAHKE